MKQLVLLFSMLAMLYPVNSYTQETDYSPLHWAAAQGYVEMMKVLADKGYDINSQDQNGFTPLHYAVAAGSFQGVEFLVDRGADVYLVNNKDITPMTLAAQAGEQKIVDYLFVKMRSIRVDQLKEESEKERINTDLVQAAKARAEAERLRQQASEWTREAEYWRDEAEKWTYEANSLKNQQIQVDQIAKERYDKIMQEKASAIENYEAERLARTAAERLLKEQNANTKAQIRAYEAQVAALAAQRATDAAIENLAEEFIKQGLANPAHYKSLTNEGISTNTDYININPTVVPVQVIDTPPAPQNNTAIEFEEVPTSLDSTPQTTVQDTNESYEEAESYEEESEEEVDEYDDGYDDGYDDEYGYDEYDDEYGYDE